jgi:Ca2+-dependent lipid-binding protein
MNAPPEFEGKKKNDIVKTFANKIIDLIIIEINTKDMKDTIKKKIIHPLLTLIYSQLYPYIVAFFVSFVMILLILIFVLIICMIMYLKKN